MRKAQHGEQEDNESMTADPKHRILVVSGRLLVAQGIVSLLESAPQIAEVGVVSNLHDALAYCRLNAPDALIIDLPTGADYFVDRPVSVDGREIKTIVLLEEEKSGQTHLYMHTPRRTANLHNLMTAILFDSAVPAQGHGTSGTVREKSVLT